jgi:hypothetical protein
MITLADMVKKVIKTGERQTFPADQVQVLPPKTQRAMNEEFEARRLENIRRYPKLKDVVIN